jgi:RNA polymerase sigma-70 factor (ECF subfamily)
MAEPSSTSAAHFPTTHWSRVARAGDPTTPEASAALAELCGAYWYPIYALIRRKGHGADAALDLTQDYFARLLEKGTVAAADPVKGRFRAFLLADCSFFLADRRDHDLALKRGGGRLVVPIDAHEAEGRYHHEPAHGDTPERLFERAWALALLDRTLDDLRRHYAATGRDPLFERLRPALTADPGAAPQAEIAQELGLTPGAVQVALHRLRARFAAVLRDRVAATLDNPSAADVDEEIRALFAVLAS